MNIYNSEPQQNKQETVVEKIDELATELEIKRMRLYDERFSANPERVKQINDEMGILEKNLSTLKKAGKIADIKIVRDTLHNKLSVEATEVADPWGQEGRDADRIQKRRDGVLSAEDLHNSVQDWNKRRAA